MSHVAFGSTSSNTIYNAFVKPKPGNLPSEAFEAQSASQFGEEVSFAGTNRKLKAVRLQLSSWGYQSGHWYSGDCRTSHAATFAQPQRCNSPRRATSEIPRPGGGPRPAPGPNRRGA